MTIKTSILELWKGALSIVIAVAAPFGAYVVDESSLKAAIGLGVIGGLTASYNWVDQALETAKLRRERAREKREAKLLADSLPEMHIPDNGDPLPDPGPSVRFNRFSNPSQGTRDGTRDTSEDPTLETDIEHVRD